MTEVQNRTLRAKDAAAYLSISTGFLRKMRKNNQGPAWIKLGRAIVYELSDLESWMQAIKKTPEQAAP